MEGDVAPAQGTAEPSGAKPANDRANDGADNGAGNGQGTYAARSAGSSLLRSKSYLTAFLLLAAPPSAC